mmetsp:Transcript_32921/g.83027  ORF Transcript_32921/g.83027 Transcript_32921/m.83027 type:complete len:229 (-) Transcript_32921:322-1008(-)
MDRIMGAAVASEKGCQDSPIPEGGVGTFDLALGSSMSSGVNWFAALSSSSVVCASEAPLSRSPPVQRSISRCTPASSSKASCRVTMSSEDPNAKWRFTSSRTLRSQISMAFSVGSCPKRLTGPALGMVLSANSSPSERRTARRTTPMAPRPSGSPSSSASSASRRRFRLKGSNPTAVASPYSTSAPSGVSADTGPASPRACRPRPRRELSATCWRGSCRPTSGRERCL